MKKQTDVEVASLVEAEGNNASKATLKVMS